MRLAIAPIFKFVLYFLTGFWATGSGVVWAKLPSMDSYIKKPGVEDSSSFCYVQRNQDAIYGQRIKEKVKIASVSKLFTTYYQLKTRGPEYRFETKLRYNKAKKELFISGSRDPYMGERVLHFLVSELNKNGIFEINKVYIDEAFAVYYDVEVQSVLMWGDAQMPSEVRYSGRSPEKSKKDLIRFFTNWKKTYSGTAIAAERLGVKMEKNPHLKVGAVELLTHVEGDRFIADKEIVYRSSSILRYLKDLNTHSNNYVADQLIASSGGIDEMIRFLKKDLGLGPNDFEFHTGSGLWVNSPYVEGKERIRTENAKDNLATCESVMNLLWELDRLMRRKGYQLQDVLMVASKDPGSLSKYSAYKGAPLASAVLAKTGTLATAAALAGEISSETGNYFFGIFFETSNSSTTKAVTTYRDNMVRDLMSELGGKNPLEYKNHPFLPFDFDSNNDSLIAAKN